MEFEAVIGLEVHAELETQSKMFCACPVVDVLEAAPNSAVCPVCAGMPGVLPVVNRQAVEYALRVALALGCEIAHTSIFERKNYFYPDLPKGYQISQYQHPLAVRGRLKIVTSQGEKVIRIRRVHLEEDTGKSTHVRPGQPSAVSGNAAPSQAGTAYSLVDLNRAGVPLLEIVTEPDLRTPEEVRVYAQELRSLLRYLGVNSGDMQKGVLRIEPNISIRERRTTPGDEAPLGTRTEVKNLNSFRALERAVAYEINRQAGVIRAGGQVVQETVGWDEARQATTPQRSKEEANDYRYFPEPDLPPLVVDDAWIGRVRASLPELPAEKRARFEAMPGISRYDAGVLAAEQPAAHFFEAILSAAAVGGSPLDPKLAANWLTGDLFALLNQAGLDIENSPVSPHGLARLLRLLAVGEINGPTAARVLVEMFQSGADPETIVQSQGLRQVSDEGVVAGWVASALAENPQQVQAYLAGKEALANFFFGQVMRKAQGQANPDLVRNLLQQALEKIRADL